jgi:hypothetical protein
MALAPKVKTLSGGDGICDHVDDPGFQAKACLPVEVMDELPVRRVVNS